MLEEQTGKSAALPHGKHLEHTHCEIVREMHQTIHQSGLDKFTFPLIDSLCNDLNAVVYDLDHLPEESFKELIEVIAGLSEARNDLRLARFLFEVEEIQPVYRLIMRNRAVLRGKRILHKVLKVWPLYNSSHE
jgi:hypothetical protein